MIQTSQKVFPEIKQIRLTGYQLTAPFTIAVPSETSSSSLLSSFFRMVVSSTKKKKVFNSRALKKVTILSDKIILLTQSNKFVVLFYSVVDDRIQVENRGSYLMDHPILKLACSSGERFDQVDDCNYAVFQQQNYTLSLFAIYDYAQAVHLYDTKTVKKALNIKFISQRQVLVIRDDGLMVLYLIRDKKLVEHEVLRIRAKEGENIKAVDIAMFTDKPDHVYIFFTSMAQQQTPHSFPSLHVLDFTYNKHVLKLDKIYSDIFSHSVTPDMLTQLVVYAFRETFFVQNQKSLWVVQYKFGTYTRADAITNLNNIYKMRVIQRHNHLFLCTFGQKQIQLCEIHIKDVGCKTRLLDVILTDQAGILAQEELISWLFKGGNKVELAFLLNHDNRTMKFYLTRKKDKLHKLVERVKKLQNSQQSGNFNSKRKIKAKVNQIQSLSQRLGFNRRQLYLSLWQKNQKNSANIIQYLIPCNDFNVIVYQIENYLRVKQLTTTQIIGILKIIQSEIMKTLKKQLDLQLIHKYLKCNFQRRKLKLYNSDKKMDYAHYSKINEMGLIDFIRYSIDLTLFPQKFYHHILWKQQKIDTPLEVHYILRQFRLIILEDYPGFLLQLLEPYQDCLIKVLSTYYYLLPQYPLKISIIREELVKLSNIYPTSQITEIQHFWLGYITQLEWMSQESSLNYLFEQLYDHFDTSFIQDKLKQFCHGGHYQIGINKDVMLVGSQRDEFQRKLPVIGQATLVLELCETVNRRALNSNKPSENEQILSLMMAKNKLPHHEYTIYLRLSRLQKILIRNQLIDPQTTLLQLMDISTVRLVGLFFLTERAKVDILFTEFSQLYESYDEFTQILKKFVQSQECSKVELQILVEYIRDLDEEEIAMNMQILALIIEGFLARIQIREMDKAKDFYDFFCELPLKDELLIKLSIFDSIKTNCYPILRQLGLGQLSYQTVINNIDQVMRLLTNNYFNKVYENKTGIYIEGMEISMAYPQNLFAVVLYLKDKIYSFRPDLECYLSFAYYLATWNQFELITDCFGSGLIIDGSQMYAEDFYLTLARHVLDNYLSQYEMIYNPQTIQHLTRLLGLLDEYEPLRIVQTAKIRFAQILATLEYDVSLQYMQIIKERWSLGRHARTVTFTQIIDNFVDTVSFSTFKEMFWLLQTMRLSETPLQHKSEQFIQITQYLCKCLSNRQQYSPLCQVIAILNENQTIYRAQQSIMIQCLLRLLSQYESLQKKDLESCRRIIDYYLTYYCDVSIVTEMYADKFADVQMEAEECRDIAVDQRAVKVMESITVQRKILWEYVVQWLSPKDESAGNMSRISGRTKSIKSRSHKSSYHMNSMRSITYKEANNKQILYCYFFVSRMLEFSDSLFDLDNISFPHDKNASIFTQLSKLQPLASQLNLSLLIIKYMKGLYKLYYNNSIQQKKKMRSLTDQNEQLVREIEDMESNVKQIQKFQQEKLLILVNEMNKDSSNEKIFLPLRKLANLLKNQTVKNVQDIEKAIVANLRTMGVKTEPAQNVNFQIITPLFRYMQNNPLSQSVASNFELRHKGRLHNYAQFSEFKKKYALKVNIASQKRLAEKILLDMKEDDDKYEPMLTNQDDSLHSSVEMLMLQDFKVDYEVQDSILQVLSEVQQQKKNLEVIIGEEQHDDELKELLLDRRYKDILENYSTKAIIRVIDAEFYNIDNLIQKNQSGSRNRRIKRAQSLNKSMKESQHKIYLLIDLIQNLKLNGTNLKHKHLKNSLGFLSLQDLIMLQSNLFLVFKLDVLLDSTHNPKRVIGKLLQNLTQLRNLQLESYSKLAQVIDTFYFKCFQDMVLIARGREQNHYLALMYLVYIQKLIDSQKKQHEKSEELFKIIKIIGRQGLTQIHDGLLRVLEGHQQVLEDYVTAIYMNYGGVAVAF